MSGCSLHLWMIPYDHGIAVPLALQQITLTLDLRLPASVSTPESQPQASSFFSRQDVRSVSPSPMSAAACKAWGKCRKGGGSQSAIFSLLKQYSAANTALPAQPPPCLPVTHPGPLAQLGGAEALGQQAAQAPLRLDGGKAGQVGRLLGDAAQALQRVLLHACRTTAGTARWVRQGARRAIGLPPSSSARSS